MDIGCTQVTARLLDGESAIVTARQLLPLPLTEDYLVRRRRREQEQEERTRQSRGARSLQVLADAGLLEKGTVLRFSLDSAPARSRQAVEVFLADHPDAVFAEWNGSLAARSLIWRHDGELYSFTGLAKTLLAEAGGEPTESLAGPTHWLLPDGRTVYEAAVQVRDAVE
jgi:hypothetical protein